MLSQVVELIETSGTFAITSHLRPDGDSLGSSLGLYWLLRALNKDVEVIMRDPVPHAYQKLPGASDVRVTPAADQSYDAVFVIECSDIARPGLLSLDNNSSSTSITMPPLLSSARSTGSIPRPPHVGEMIYNLAKARACG